MGCAASASAESAPASAPQRYALRQQRREQRRQEREDAGLPEDTEDASDNKVASETQMLHQAAAVRRKYTKRCDKADAAALARISRTRSQPGSPVKTTPMGLAGCAAARPPGQDNAASVELLPHAHAALPGQVVPFHDGNPMTVPPVEEPPAPGSSSDLSSRGTTGSGAFSLSGTVRSSGRATGSPSPAGLLSRALSVFELLESDDDDDAGDDAALTSAGGQGLEDVTSIAATDEGEGDKDAGNRLMRDGPRTDPTPFRGGPAASSPGLGEVAFDAGDEDDDIPAEYLLSHAALSKFSSGDLAGSALSRVTSAASGDFDAKSGTSRTSASAGRATPLESLRSKIQTPADIIVRPPHVQRRPTASLPSRAAVVPGRLPRRKRPTARKLSTPM